MNAAESRDMTIFKIQNLALIVGIVGLAATIFGFVSAREQFFRSYLVGFVFIAALSLGAIALLMVQYLTGGAWGALTRRPLEASIKNVPLVAVAFLPILAGLDTIFLWSRDEVMAHDAVLKTKLPYLNDTGFIARNIFYFVLWGLFAFLLSSWSKKAEDAPSLNDRLKGALRLRYFSGIGLVLMALTLTFASVDWLMSLEPHWYSTMFGISFMVGCVLTAWAFTIMVTVSLSKGEPVSRMASPLLFRDLGNLMFAFMMLWAYTGFSEFLLIWYGNLHEEIPWFIFRTHGGWGFIASMLIVLHFFVPFFFLLNRVIKDNPKTLALFAGLLLVMRVVNYLFIIVPSFRHDVHDPHIHWLDITSVIGLFGIWLFFFIRNLNSRTLLPMHEVEVREALAHG